MLYVISAIALGAAWRRMKGSEHGGWPASLTFPLIHAFPLLPLCGSLDPGKWALAYLLLCGLSALFLLVEANNGGNGKPLLRFGPFGLGYWWAYREGYANWTVIGELWLGGSWFGAWAALAIMAGRV